MYPRKQAALDWQVGYWIAGIIVAILAVVGSLWKVRKYVKTSQEQSFQRGVQQGQSQLEKAKFLVLGDRLIMGKDAVFTEGDRLLESATRYIKIITVTGAAWLLEKKIKKTIEKKCQEGIEIKIILQDPTSPVVEHVEAMESEFTITPRPYERPHMTGIRLNIRETINALKKSADIRVYSGCFSWKGTIVDGKKAMYTLFDVPRNDTPLRMTENEKVVEHFEKYYFNNVWERSKSA